MKVNPNSNTNFKAGIKLENKHLYEYRGWGMDWQFRKELEDLKNSPTNNTYGIRPIVEEKGMCEVLLNGEPFCKEELNPPSYPVFKKFFGIILEKEKSIVASMKGTDLHTKLESIRGFIKKTGVSLEDAKRYL
jgi:hypothetical protein